MAIPDTGAQNAPGGCPNITGIIPTRRVIERRFSRTGLAFPGWVGLEYHVARVEGR